MKPGSLAPRLPARPALAGGAYESVAVTAYWQREQIRRSLDASAERNPEGIEADAADRF